MPPRKGTPARRPTERAAGPRGRNPPEVPETIAPKVTLEINVPPETPEVNAPPMTLGVNVPTMPLEVQNFLQNLVQSVVQSTLQSTQAATNTAQPSESRGRNMVRDFQQQQPPKFQGTEGPVDAENWLENLNQIFKLLKITDEEDRILLASSQLINDAAKWWRMIEELGSLTNKTWKGFKEIFLGRYFPEEKREAKAHEFNVLSQRNTTVAEYQVEFTRLSVYAPYMVDTKSKKTRKFGRDIRSAFKSRVISPAAKAYAEIINRATTVEKDLIEFASFMERRRKQNNTNSFQSRKRFRFGAPCPQASISVVQSSGSVFACFHCGQVGHSKKNCPQLSRTQPVLSSGGTFTCCQCWQTDHMRRNCPQLRQGSTARGSFRPPGRSFQPHMT